MNFHHYLKPIHRAGTCFIKQFFLSLSSFITMALYAQEIPGVDTTIAQVINLPKTTVETISNNVASISYGRPYKSGYTIFGNMKKYGRVWSPGAGKTTTVTFSRNVIFAGQPVNEGTYSLFVIPYEDQWTLILNTQAGHPGVSAYEKYKDKNIVTVSVPVLPLITAVEQLTIRFPLLTSMIIEWDKVQVVIPVI